ncbi:DUF5667 domain-containing protein [Nocardioides marinquilinus]|uniref:DUF5667 domain-containing protein n=1 Tax=Nocardioides marinquilinus TaxID=1210400 RepID=A0ABP9PK01_9ACTN
MSPVFSARRRADEFAALVEDPSTAAADPTRYADLLELVGALRSEPAPEPRPAFVADLRERLMVAAEEQLAPARTAAATAPAGRGRTDDERRRARRERRIAALVGGVAVVSATGSMAVAAQTALPGDTLYPLKRALENIQTGIQNDPEDKGSTLLDNATGRLDEVGELSRSTDDADPAVIAETLDDFAEQATEASDLLLDDYAATGRTGAIDELRDFTDQSTAALDALEPLVPEEARGSLVAANQVVEQIQQQLVTACPACIDLTAGLTAGVDDAVDRLPGVLDAALGDLVTPVLPPADPRPSGRPDEPRGSGGPTAQPQPSQQPSGTPAPPGTSQPPAPQPTLPTGTDRPDQPAQPSQTPDVDTDLPVDDPIGDLVTGATGGTRSNSGGGGRGGSDDPVGDLLEGTGDVVDGVVDGLGGLGGQG